jgi:hypothetical protein
MRRTRASRMRLCSRQTTNQAENDSCLPYLDIFGPSIRRAHRTNKGRDERQFEQWLDHRQYHGKRNIIRKSYRKRSRFDPTNFCEVESRRKCCVLLCRTHKCEHLRRIRVEIVAWIQIQRGCHLRSGLRCRTALPDSLFSTPDAECRSLLVTSADPLC